MVTTIIRTMKAVNKLLSRIISLRKEKHKSPWKTIGKDRILIFSISQYINLLNAKVN